MRRLLLVLAFTSVPLAAAADQAADQAADRAADMALLVKPPPLAETDLDRSADPCVDFYQFACGGWIAKTEIPPDLPAWSRGFISVARRNEELLRGILEDDAAHPPADSEGTKLGAYYGTCMDEAKAETASLTALQGRLAALGTVKDRKSLAVQLARAHLEWVGGLFSFGNDQDAKDSSQMIGAADQGGLGLPDRDYYLGKEPRFKKIRDLYRAHVIAMLELLGDKPAKAKAEAATIMKIETALAKASMDRVQRRDPNAVYHRLERQGLEKLTPEFDWNDYFAALGVPGVQAINVAVPDFFKGLNELLKTTSLTDVKTYLRWHVLDRADNTLGKKFVDEAFRYSSAAFSGQPQLPPRWKRCVGATTHAMSQPLAKAFVAKTFGPESKADAKTMIAEVEGAMENDLKTLPWMDDPTRQAALAKLAKVANYVGYPDHWRDYSGLKVGRSSYLENSFDAAIFESLFQLHRIGRPVDRSYWDMSPTEVNAYYSGENNKMVFPAGILQAPFYDHGAPAPVNYGAIGMVMGHELTHGFDDQGRKFDAQGNLRNWWSDAAAKDFEGKAQCLADQYSSYVGIDDIHVNGKLTLGENIADQGGVKLSYNAWLAKTGGQGPDALGFNAKQQFFLGMAHSWCMKMRPEAQRMRLQMDPHSPARFRVNGPLSNFDEFAAAFSCKAGTPMAPEKRCKIW